MVEESNKGGWLILAGALTLHLAFASLPSYSPGGTGFARSLIMDALTPAERLVDRSVSGLTSLWSDYFALLDTREENERLQSEVDRLEVERHLSREAILEADRLRRFFDIDYPIGKPIVARVTGGDPSISQRTVTLDKGRAAGIEPPSPGRTPDGIVGRVIYASYYSSIVQLVTDPVSAVGAVVQDSRVQGIVRGNGTSQLIFEHSESGAPLVPGQLVVTSGIERIYPKGLPIGVISAVETVTDLVSTALIEPSADLDRLEEVVLLGLLPEELPEPDMVDGLDGSLP